MNSRIGFVGSSPTRMFARDNPIPLNGTHATEFMGPDATEFMELAAIELMGPDATEDMGPASASEQVSPKHIASEQVSPKYMAY